jgi:hypothetical protein
MFRMAMVDGQHVQRYHLNLYLLSIRICVGMHFANQTLQISIATMLWALDIKPSDENDTFTLKSDLQWEDDGLIVCVFISSRLIFN